MPSARSLRRDMVDHQIAGRDIADTALLDAMREVPREAFVPRSMAEFAYEDSALLIEAGQTIPQPYIVAAMIEAGAIDPDDRVLEIGAGSDYAAAVMSRIVARVDAIERHVALADLALAHRPAGLRQYHDPHQRRHAPMPSRPFAAPPVDGSRPTTRW